MPEQTPIKAETMWAVITADGYILMSTIGDRRKDSVRRYMKGSLEPWSYWRKKFGLTVQRIQIGPTSPVSAPRAHSQGGRP